MKIVSFKKIKKFFFTEVKPETVSDTCQLQISLKKLSDLIDQEISDEITTCAKNGRIINIQQAEHQIKNRDFLKRSRAKLSKIENTY